MGQSGPCYPTLPHPTPPHLSPHLPPLSLPAAQLKAEVSELEDCAPALGVALGALSQYASVSVGRPLGLSPLGPVPGQPVGDSSPLSSPLSTPNRLCEAKLVGAAYDAIKATLASTDMSSVIDLNEDVLAGRRRNAADLPAE